MSDLIELLREMTDDGSAARGDAVVFERAAAAARPLRRRRRARRAIAGATALAVVVATVVFVVGGNHSSSNNVRVEITSPPATVPPLSAAAVRAGHWGLIPQAPVPGDGVPVWTGRELIEWGGEIGGPGTMTDTGAAYDPATNSWRVLPSAPISARADNAAVWTGREMLVWGGDTSDAGAKTNDGAAYNPTTNRWRRLPSAPLPPQANTVAVWTGSRVLLLDNGDARAAAYEPSTNRWTAISAPALPRHTDVRWTQAVALGTSGKALAWLDWENFVHTGPNSYGGTSGAALVDYDAGRNQWRALPVANGVTDPHEAIWTGSNVLVRGDDRTCLTCTGPPARE
ncbi:MAG TPA: hypothetical protein VGO03_20330, partial [Acidimicrobiia bacterium]